jgi:hypothetical protein
MSIKAIFMAIFLIGISCSYNPITITVPSNFSYQDTCMATNSSGLNFFGDSIGACTGHYVGDVGLLFLFFVGFFLAYTVLQNTRVEAKAVILIPVFILSATFFPWMLIAVAMVASFLLFLALNKVSSR